MRTGLLRGLRDFSAEGSALSGATLHDPLSVIYEAAMKLLTENKSLDGIICGSSAGAVAIASAIEASGRTVGGDIDMVSKQPANLLRFMKPEIMTVGEDIRLAGRELAKAVIARIEGVPAERLQSISLPDGRLVYPN
jgi:LacI family transcriptional regulator